MLFLTVLVWHYLIAGRPAPQRMTLHCMLRALHSRTETILRSFHERL